jgi:hypothetical protein
MEWKPISSAPFDRDPELAVINRDGALAAMAIAGRKKT